MAVGGGGGAGGGAVTESGSRGSGSDEETGSGLTTGAAGAALVAAWEWEARFLRRETPEGVPLRVPPPTGTLRSAPPRVQ